MAFVLQELHDLVIAAEDDRSKTLHDDSQLQVRWISSTESSSCVR